MSTRRTIPKFEGLTREPPPLQLPDDADCQRIPLPPGLIHPIEVPAGLDRSRLEELEQIIERGMQAFVEVGSALLTIQAEKLYRLTHGTFADYCKERWGFGKSRAYQLIDAAEIVHQIEQASNVHPGGQTQPVYRNPPILPSNEKQVRALKRLSGDQGVVAWNQAVQESEGDPTVAKVKEVVDRMIADRTQHSHHGGHRPSGPPPVLNVDPIDLPWLETLPLYQELAGRSRDTFTRDALIWRRTWETCQALQVQLRDASQEIGGVGGAFFHGLKWAVSIPDPANWLACDQCGGAGSNGNRQCSDCRGNGYVLKQK